MKSLIGAAFVAGALVVAGPAAISPAAAAPQAKTQSAGTSDATDFSAHRYVRRHYRHYGYSRPHYRPYYYGSARSTIGRIPITRRRRSPSASGLVRSGGERAQLRAQPQISFALSLVRFSCAFIFAVGAFMARSRACL